jgi:uncharacterized protein YpmB
MNQSIYDTLGLAISIITFLTNAVALVFLIIYTRATSSIATATELSADETARIADLTTATADITAKTLEELIATRDARIAPHVFVYLDQMEGEDSTKIFLVVKNAGSGVAKDVRISFDPELQPTEGYNLEHIKRLTSYIPTLPPGEEIRHAFAFTIDYYKAEPALPSAYDVHISYYGGIVEDKRTSVQQISMGFFTGRRSNRLTKIPAHELSAAA